MGRQRVGIPQILTKATHVFLDSMFFIYHFEESPRFSDFTTVVLDGVEKGKTKASTSYLTLMEILVKPLKQGRTDLVEAYKVALETFPNLRLIPFDGSAVLQASTFRATYGLKPPDSIQLASALASNCDVFLTNDKGLARITELKVICMEDLVL